MNEKDILEINEKYLRGLKFYYVEYLYEVIPIALHKEKFKSAINIY